MRPYEEITKFINEGLELWVQRPENHRWSEVQLDLRQVFGVHKNLDNSYVSFEIPKKSGEMRLIEAPNKKLKLIQRGIKERLDSLFHPEEGAHGFVKGRSIQTNARLHTGQAWILNLDIAGFFPSIKRGRIKAIFQLDPFGLSEGGAGILAELCTRDLALPQGAPTSPTITNIVVRRMDRKLQALADHYGCIYTRYADDITFSAASKKLLEVVLNRTERILKVEGFTIQASKTRIHPSSFRQEVTGLIVNDQVNTPRKYRRQLRATLNAWEREGMSVAMERNGFDDPELFLSSVQGRIQHAYYTQVTPEVSRLRTRFFDLKANQS